MTVFVSPGAGYGSDDEDHGRKVQPKIVQLPVHRRASANGAVNVNTATSVTGYAGPIARRRASNESYTNPNTMMQHHQPIQRSNNDGYYNNNTDYDYNTNNQSIVPPIPVYHQKYNIKSDIIAKMSKYPTGDADADNAHDDASSSSDEMMGINKANPYGYNLPPPRATRRLSASGSMRSRRSRRNSCNSTSSKKTKNKQMMVDTSISSNNKMKRMTSYINSSESESDNYASESSEVKRFGYSCNLNNVDIDCGRSISSSKCAGKSRRNSCIPTPQYDNNNNSNDEQHCYMVPSSTDDDDDTDQEDPDSLYKRATKNIEKQLLKQQQEAEEEKQKKKLVEEQERQQQQKEKEEEEAAKQKAVAEAAAAAKKPAEPAQQQASFRQKPLTTPKFNPSGWGFMDTLTDSFPFDDEYDTHHHYYSNQNNNNNDDDHSYGSSLYNHDNNNNSITSNTLDQFHQRARRRASVNVLLHEIKETTTIHFIPAEGCSNASDFLVRCFAVRLRTHGFRVLKHNRNRFSKSKHRILYLLNDGKTLTWKPTPEEIEKEKNNNQPNMIVKYPKIDLVSCVEVRHAWTCPKNTNKRGTAVLRNRCGKNDSALAKSFSLIFGKRTLDLTAFSNDQAKVLMEGFSALIWRLHMLKEQQGTDDDGNQSDDGHSCHTIQKFMNDNDDWASTIAGSTMSPSLTNTNNSANNNNNTIPYSPWGY